MRAGDKAFVFDVLGCQCNCCGLSDARFLTLDHVHGDGASERRRAAGRNVGGTCEIYRRMRKSGHVDTSRYQLLCYNCNCAKRNGDKCPHQLDREAALSAALASPTDANATQEQRERYSHFR